MADTPDVEQAALELDRAIRSELDSIQEAARELAARARKLGESGRAVNGLAAASVTWARDLEVVAQKVADEGPEVSKALLGRGIPEITTHTNAELANAVTGEKQRGSR